MYYPFYEVSVYIYICLCVTKQYPLESERRSMHLLMYHGIYQGAEVNGCFHVKSFILLGALDESSQGSFGGGISIEFNRYDGFAIQPLGIEELKCSSHFSRIFGPVLSHVGYQDITLRLK